MRAADVAGDVAALEVLVGAEDAAANVLAGVGGRLATLGTAAATTATAVQAAYAAHTARRTAWANALTARNARVPAALDAYPLPTVADATAGATAAAGLETTAGAAYRRSLDLLLDATLRRQAGEALVDAAGRAYAFTALAGAPASSAFPGQDG